MIPKYGYRCPQCLTTWMSCLVAGAKCSTCKVLGNRVFYPTPFIMR